MVNRDSDVTHSGLLEGLSERSYTQSLVTGRYSVNSCFSSSVCLIAIGSCGVSVEAENGRGA